MSNYITIVSKIKISDKGITKILNTANSIYFKDTLIITPPQKEEDVWSIQLNNIVSFYFFKESQHKLTFTPGSVGVTWWLCNLLIHIFAQKLQGYIIYEGSEKDKVYPDPDSISTYDKYIKLSIQNYPGFIFKKLERYVELRIAKRILSKDCYIKLVWGQ